MPRLLFLLCLACAFCRGETDPDTKLVFPPEAGAWVSGEVHTYDHPSLGRSYAYNPKSGGNGAITLYIYDKGLSGLTTGASSRLVKAEIAEVVAQIETAWLQRGAKVEDVDAPAPFRFSPEGPLIAYYGVNRITLQGVQNISVSIVTGYRGKFLKLRYTHPGNDVATAKHDIGIFLEALYAVNRETLDPLLRPPVKAAP